MPTGTPGGAVQIPEYSASRGPRARGRGCKTALKAPILSPNASRAARFFTGCGSWCLPFAQNPVCRHPRLLNTPKNARRILPQAPAARRRIVSASPVTVGGPRAYLPNLSALISSVLKTSMMHPYTIDVDTIRCGPRGDPTFRWRPQGCPRFLTCPARAAASRDRRMT